MDARERRGRGGALALALPLTLLPALFGTPAREAPSVVPDRASATYARGETVGWTASLPPGTHPDATYIYAVQRNGGIIGDAGSLSPSDGPVRIEVKGEEPGMLLLNVTPVTGEAKGPARDFGAAVAPERIRPVAPRPRDFDAFWKRKLAELARVPANAVYTPKPSPTEGVEYGLVRLDTVGGEHVYGQFARPAKPGRYPAILQMQWAGGPYALDPAWIVGRARQGFLVLNIEPHNVLPTEPPAYYAALPERLKRYSTIGSDSREESYFTRMYLRDVRAARYLMGRPDWDGKALVAAGGSMGGQQALAVAGLVPEITHAIAEEPAGCDLAGPLYDRAASYPFLDVKTPSVRAAAAYMDAVNFAPRIRARTLVGIGYVDRVCPPTGIWTAFNLIPAPKEAVPLPEAPHNNLATPAQMAPFRARAEEWYAALAVGKPVPITPAR